MALPDGAVVHGDVEFSCLRGFGEAWRSAASSGLIALGLEPPLEENSA
jgi:hypothetical protein